jgi:glycosyltransferase involved in cell wall biosynthesis
MPSLRDITPVILTYNEADNIGRCLTALLWARKIIIVDSGSDDATQHIVGNYENTELYVRKFDTHADQWNYAVSQTGISTEWVLALDADYIFTDNAKRWVETFDGADVAGVSFPFEYAVHGRVLRSGIYPPVTVLYRLAAAHYVQDGHTQRVIIDGRVARAPIKLIHDDRKPLKEWFQAQARYAGLEGVKLSRELSGIKAWLRGRTPFSPILLALHCLVIRGGLFEGPRGWLYGLQRMCAEAMIVIAYRDHQIRERYNNTRL